MIFHTENIYYNDAPKVVQFCYTVHSARILKDPLKFSSLVESVQYTATNEVTFLSDRSSSANADRQ